MAIIGTLSSVLGGIAGYFIGKFFYVYIGAPLISWYGLSNQVATLGQVFKEHVFLTILLASLSPVPYKVFTLSAGLFSVNLAAFITASFIGRGIRFFIVSYFADRYGVRAKTFILKQRKDTAIVFLIVTLCVVVYFLLVKQGIL